MSSNIILNKMGFLTSLYGKFYMHKGILKISDGDDLVIPKEHIYEFLHDLGVLVQEAFEENVS